MEKRNEPDLPHSRIFLCAPVNALVEGIYEERVPLSELKKHGDFGLGTFDHLDGEMILVDGRFFQITSRGVVNEVGETGSTPFACVTFYQPLTHDEIHEEMAYGDLLEWLQGLFPSPNIFYALRIDGLFSRVVVRSVPRQDSYRPLTEVAGDQPVFHFENVRGTLAGFHTPSFLSSVNVPGLHLHFLSRDRRHGGHLLECVPRSARVGVQFLTTLELALPLSLDYLTWEFRRDVRDDLEKAEK